MRRRKGWQTVTAEQTVPERYAAFDDMRGWTALQIQRAYKRGDIKIKHPAKFSAPIIAKIREILDGITADWDFVPVVFDPFAGVGGIHALQEKDADGNGYVTVGVEIEWEWAAIGKMRGPTICADFFKFDWDRERMGGAPDFIVTSCTYGNRFADKHEAKDASTRRSYKHDLGHELRENNSGGMQWGRPYRKFHVKAWRRCWDTLDRGGYLVLNVSDHVRGREVVPVAQWHNETLVSIGFQEVRACKIETRRMRMGENHEARVDGEWIFVFRKWD